MREAHRASASGSWVTLVTRGLRRSPGTGSKAKASRLHVGVCEALPARLPDAQTGCRLPLHGSRK